MPAFAITTTTPNSQLDKQRRGEVAFTVTNQSGGRIKGRAEIKADDPAQAQWLTLSGPSEQEFDPDEVKQFVVRIAVPDTAPQGTCKFRLNIISPSKRTSEDEGVEGPNVSVAVPAPPAPVPPPPFPWWIIAVVAGVLVIVGGVLLWYLNRPPALPNAGEPCKDGKCAAGLWCPADKCVADNTGSPCQKNEACSGQPCAQANDGMICMRAVGAPCDKENWAQCSSLFCKDGKCAVSPNGVKCRYDVQCESNNCKDGVCAAVVVPCPNPCPRPMVCSNGQCTPPFILMKKIDIVPMMLRR